LVGKKLGKGVQPYQDFGLITDLRNALLHFKGNKSYDPKITPEEFHDSLIKKFENKNPKLLAEDMEAGSWLHAIETKAIADWCCKTAAQIIVDFVSKTPKAYGEIFCKPLIGTFYHMLERLRLGRSFQRTITGESLTLQRLANCQFHEEVVGEPQTGTERASGASLVIMSTASDGRT